MTNSQIYKSGSVKANNAHKFIKLIKIYNPNRRLEKENYYSFPNVFLFLPRRSSSLSRTGFVY